MKMLQIGDRGVFKLKEPFAILVTPQVVYEVRALRTLNDYVAGGESPYDRFYKPFNISEKDYHLAVSKNECIVALNSGTGEWIYVPESYIEGMPSMSGIKYTNIILAVRLGAIPDTTSLEALVASIREQVMGYIGIDAEVRVSAVSQSSFIDADKHTRLENARQNKISISETDFSRAKKLEAENATLKQRVRMLEDFIARNKP